MPGGRPTDYDAQVHPAQCEELAEQGYTDWQIAKRLGTTTTSFKNWKQQHPEFLAALEKGRDAMLDNLPPSMYRKAMGYEVDEVSVTVEEIITAKPGSVKDLALKDARERRVDGEGVYQVKRTTTTKHFAPDSTMLIFVACNRLPKGHDPADPDAGWAHVNRVEVTGGDGGPVRVELDAARAALEGALAGIADRAGAGEGTVEPD